MTLLPSVAQLAAVSTTPLRLPHIDYLSIVPIIVMMAGAVVILAWSSLLRRPMDVTWVTSLTMLTAIGALVMSLFQWYSVLHSGAHPHVAGAVVMDGFSALVGVLVTSAVFLSAAIGDSWMRREGIEGPEYHVLMLVSASGAMIMGAANDLIVIFLGLEILSIALYVLAAFDGRRAESGEASLKYFVLGGFSSAIFVYGIALTYGATGTSNLPQIADYLARNVMLHNGLLLAGLALLLVGFGFKVAAVPFHLWTPDVYQGSPTPVTGFMAAVAKAGGFAAVLRVFVSSFSLLRSDWRPIVFWLAILTLALGAVVALWQRDVKRMLAYSSINHAGFVLLGLQAASGRGVSAALYYLFVYSFMVVGTFGVVTVVGGTGDHRHGLQAYRGLGRRQPWLAGALAVLLLAQAGVPFTTGFVAKLEVVEAVVHGGSADLAVVAMVSAAIAAFFYLRLVLTMYAPPADAADTPDGAFDLLAAGGAGPRSAGTVVEPALVATGEAGSVAVGEAGLVAAGEAGSVAVVSRPPTDDDLAIPAGVAFAVTLCVLVTVVFGIWPQPLTSFAHHATLMLHP